MLEGWTLAPLVSALVALAGVLVGLGIARFVLPGTRKIKRLEAEIEQMRREHAEYRGRVTTHFHKTAELIGNMTASYKAVYDHLSDGAQTLCSGEALTGPGIFPGPRLILADDVAVTPAGLQAVPPAPETPPREGRSVAPSVPNAVMQPELARRDGATEGPGSRHDPKAPVEPGVAAGAENETSSSAADAAETEKHPVP